MSFQCIIPLPGKLRDVEVLTRIDYSIINLFRSAILWYIPRNIGDFVRTAKNLDLSGPSKILTAN